MSGRQARANQCIKDILADQVAKGEWKTSASANGFVNGLVLAVHILDHAIGEPPYLLPPAKAVPPSPPPEPL